MSDPDLRGALVLAEYAPGEAAVLSDAERWPTLDAAGSARLSHWREHPDAPHWTHATGDRLTAEQVQRVRHPLSTDDWLTDHLAAARRTLRYRGMPTGCTLDDFPTISRADLVDDLAAFVPLDADLSRMLHGTSSGSTGAALLIPDDVEEVARGFHLLVALAASAGASVTIDGERMTVANLVFQRQAFTYVSVISSFAHRAMARLNLHPTSWRGLGARSRFLAEADPQILSGHPTSLAELLDAGLDSVLHPAVIFSGAMALSAALRARLEAAFECPVVDVYGLHETRPIAARIDDGPFRVLDRRVHVEVWDPRREVALPPGAMGEIVVTAGENPLLPLVRYRTGDYGRLVHLDGGAVGIADLEGRENTRFRAGDGTLVPCVELTQHLQAHGAQGWSIDQDAAGRVHAVIVGGDESGIRSALGALLGVEFELRQVERLIDLGEGKPRRYRSAVPD
ncbi:AMP-binding protein [Microbacterium foliorum]|uniref:AMP-binding protein n=1 Tax=Microbacterium foliorum TaxID=104336 RepID=A0A4Y5YTN6_9MICO|nr:AMP-binding protein [Microbacterium foliorum]QDE35699.1 AMP-binding protein [Microbacterium foliorum]